MKRLALCPRAAQLKRRFDLTGGEAVLLALLCAQDAATRADLQAALARAGSTGASEKLIDVLLSRLRRRLAGVATIATLARAGGDGRALYALNGLEAVGRQAA